MNLGAIEVRRGRPRVAVRMLTRALAAGSLPSPPMAAEAMNNLGSACRDLGDFEVAVRHHSEALEIMCDFGDRAGESEVRIAYAATLRAMGDDAGAALQYQQALDLADQVHARYEQANALRGLAETLGSADPRTAVEYRRRARDLFEELGLPEKDELADPDPRPRGRHPLPAAPTS
jgi:tetratricopeptide (TPR) repeat protein